MGVRYRLWQVWLNFTVRRGLPAAALAEIEALLAPGERALFARFLPRDQQHSYLVFRSLRDDGQDDLRLLRAALLHDIGKARERPSPWDRIWPVLVEKVAPRLAARWGAGRATGWRRAFAIRQQHAAWGAEMAAAAGSDPLVVALIRRHQDPLPPGADALEDRLLRLLQAADDRA